MTHDDVVAWDAICSHVDCLRRRFAFYIAQLHLYHDATMTHMMCLQVHSLLDMDEVTNGEVRLEHLGQTFLASMQRVTQ
jgi:hypothetical protein